MTLRRPDTVELARQQRDRLIRLAEDELESAVATAIRFMLGKMRRVGRQQLTASSALPTMTSEMYTLGQVQGWWTEAVDQNVMGQVGSVWQRGRSDATDAPFGSRSQDALGDYLSTVRNRLTMSDNTPAEQAFHQVRVALAQEIARGSATSTVAERIAAELNWQGEDVGFWKSRQASLDSQIDALLDPLGPPGTPAREAARLNDPAVRALQDQRSEAVRRLDRDRSSWQHQATRIARTETTGAYNAGSLNAYFEEGAGAKMWIATWDDRTRETHAAAHGQCVPVGEQFTVGFSRLTFPGDPVGPPEEVINCRCTTIGGRNCEELGGWMSDETAGFAIAEEDPEPEDLFRGAATIKEVDDQLAEIARLQAEGKARLGKDWDYSPEDVRLHFQRDTVRREFQDKVFAQTVDWSRDPVLLKARDAYVVNDTATLKMNATLRKKAGQGSVSARAQQIDELVANSTIRTDVVLHRGVAVSDDIAQAITPGTRIVDHGFQSTALSADTSRFYVNARAADMGGDQTRVMYRILAPRGTKATPVDFDEVVLARGVKMDVVAVTSTVENGAKWRYVDVRIVND